MFSSTISVSSRLWPQAGNPSLMLMWASNEKGLEPRLFHCLPDKRTDPWLLVYSPVPVIVIFLVYLCVLWAGPRLMKHRGPVDLKGVLIVYNFAMVCLSVYMFYEVSRLVSVFVHSHIFFPLPHLFLVPQMYFLPDFLCSALTYLLTFL